jgi:competence protein ComEC
MLKVKTWLGDRIWQSAAITIVCQAGVLSFTIMFFNYFPTYFILGNVVIIPLASLIIIMGCIIPMVYPITFLSTFLAFALNKLTALTEFLTAKVASIPGSSIEGIGMTLPECIMIAIIVSSLMFWITRKDNRALNLMLVCVFLLVTHNLFTSTSLKKTNELIVYNSYNETVIGIRTGKTLTVFSTDSTISSDVNRHCSTLGLRYKLEKLNDMPAYIEINGKKIVVANEIDDYILEQSTPDFVILAGQRPVIRSTNFQAPVIVSSSAPQRFRIYDNIAQNLQTIHYVRTSGAYRARL